jgi:hypothetical protein
MGETTLSRLDRKRRFPMKRFLVLALVGALSVVGGTGLALGESPRPQPHPKTEAKKASPPASPGKRPPSTSPTKGKKSGPTAKRPPAQASKSQARAPKGPAKQGKGPQHGAGSYSGDNYKRDLDKAGKEVMEGFEKALPGDLAILGGAVAGGGPGAVAGAITGAPSLIEGGAEGLKGEWDALSATGKFIGARVNDAQKANQPPAKPKKDAPKSNKTPAKPKPGSGR